MLCWFRDDLSKIFANYPINPGSKVHVRNANQDSFIRPPVFSSFGVFCILTKQELSPVCSYAWVSMMVSLIN